MITPKSQLRDTYPLPVYRFQVEVYPYLGSLLAAISVTAFGGIPGRFQRCRASTAVLSTKSTAMA